MSATTLKQDVRSVIEELDPDGGGFRTREAANLLVTKVSFGGVCLGDGTPKPKVRQLMRMGALAAIRGFKGFVKRGERFREKAAEHAYEDAQHGQGDFADMEPEDWDKRWLATYHAWEEDDDAERKALLRMTLPEIRAVIDLKRKKAAEAEAVANHLQDVIDDHPEWLHSPLRTLGQILGVFD